MSLLPLPQMPKKKPSRETIGERMLVHGHARMRKHTPTYRTWNMMLARCRNPNFPGFRYYGARGISVCERWLSFQNFLADMGERPSLDHSIDRIDSGRGYEPSNCRWATHKEQRRNQKRNRQVERSDGLRFRTMAEAAEATGGNRRCIRDVCTGRHKTHQGFTWRFVE